jgi:predicted metal-dependent phosphoesterase TrpH
MVVADLHVHTTVSDGRLTLEELPAVAEEAGVPVVGVTDHDRYHPELDAPVSRRGGVTVVRGIELRADAGGQRVDLLGYGLTETEALAAECDRIQRDRVERARRMVQQVEAETGVEVEVDLSPGVGRPDIARGIAASGAAYDYEAAFDELIGSDCPCYVPRDVPAVEEAVSLLRTACDVVSLAHPFRYPDPSAALSLVTEYDLDAVERFYPYDRTAQPDQTRLDELLAEHDLLVTGGSDAHELTLGRTGLDEAAWRRLRERLDTSGLDD